MPPVSPSQPPTHIEFQMLIKFVVTPLFKIWDNIKLRKVKEWNMHILAPIKQICTIVGKVAQQ